MEFLEVALSSFGTEKYFFSNVVTIKFDKGFDKVRSRGFPYVERELPLSNKLDSILEHWVMKDGKHWIAKREKENNKEGCL